MVDIYFIKPTDGKYEKAINLGSVINITGGYSGDPCIAHDESHIIFPSVRTAGANNGDLFISFNEKGTWTEPVNMGKLINTQANEYGPFFSPASCRSDVSSRNWYFFIAIYSKYF